MKQYRVKVALEKKLFCSTQRDKTVEAKSVLFGRWALRALHNSSNYRGLLTIWNSKGSLIFNRVSHWNVLVIDDLSFLHLVKIRLEDDKHRRLSVIKPRARRICYTSISLSTRPSYYRNALQHLRLFIKN